MLRVGLTGGLGSGKSTAGAMLAEMGAHVVSADEIGRALMEPGEAVYGEIVARFGPGVVGSDGRLDRPALARVAFEGGRLEELNAVVHPAVIAEQARLAAEVEQREPAAVFVVESALLFETEHGGEGGWRRRFDRVVLVTAPDEAKVERYARRVGGGEGARAEARRRLSRQRPDAEKAGLADFVVRNEGSLAELRGEMERVWRALQGEAAQQAGPGRVH